MLNVRLDNDEAITMFLAANKDATGMLKFEHFAPMFRVLLQKAYTVDGGDEWAHVGFTDGTADGLPVYLNIDTGEMVEMARVNSDEHGEAADTLDFEMMISAIE